MTISALIIDDEQLARDELAYLLESAKDVDVVAQGTNGIEAVELIEEHHPDLVFLDVQMPGLDGFAVIQRVMDRHRKQKESDGWPLPQFVFATAYDQYAVRAFDVNAVDYLLKPFDRGARGEGAGAGARAHDERRCGEWWRRVADRITTGCAAESAEESAGAARAAQRAKLIVQAGSRLLLVDQAEICFAEIEEGVIRVVTQQFEGQSKCRTIEELLDQLDPAVFWRAHRSFVVNINQIREVVPWFKSTYQLRMNDKKQTEIPVSRAQTKRLRELFNL